MLIDDLLVLLFAPGGFYLGTAVFPSPQKPTFISKFQFNLESGRRRTTKWMCYLYMYLSIVIFIIFIYLFIHKLAQAKHSLLSLDANVSSFSLAESPPRDLQVTAYK